MRREADLSVVTCPLSPREREALDQAKASLGLASDANAMRTALYGLCVQADVNLDTNLFRLRGQSKRQQWHDRKRVDKRQKRVVWNQKVSA
jgi:hypothetical protein